MARKVFISFLGATKYNDCDYQKDGLSYGTVRYIQEATLNYLTQKEEWKDNSIAYILLTKGSEEKNWIDNGQTDFKTKEPIIQSGLKTQLEKMNLPFLIEPIKEVPDGNNEEEIWEIFERTFEKIQDEDELYFDLTHGYRYLPMLILVLGNYSKFLKKVTIKSITYGNFEISERGTKPGLIVDLLPLSALQDWTYAAGQYLDSGNVEKLTELSNKEIKPILAKTKGSDESARKLKTFINSLNSVIAERQTCRGINIVESTNIRTLKENVADIETTFISPLNPIFQKIKASLVSFDAKENVKNGLASAIWCFNNGLLQQSATILQEFVVSFFCLRHDIAIVDETKRKLINSAFAIKFKHLDEEQWDVNEEQKIKIKAILLDDLFNNVELINLFNNLTEVRNDLNHSGMRSKRNPQSAKSIKDNIQKCIDGFARILYNVNFIKSC